MRRPALLAPSCLVLALTLSLGACGGDDEPAPDAGPTSESSAAEPDAGAEEEGTAEEEQGAPAGGVTFVDTTEAAAVVSIGPDGFDPAEVAVAVGDVVQFSAADDGLYSVIVSDLDGYTVGSGLDEYFRFDQPGSYPVTEDLSGASMSVVVE